MSDIHRSVTVTVKSGKNHDDWWAVFRGTSYEVYEDVATFFGFERESVTNLSLHELVNEASKTAQGVATFVRELGATIVPSPKPAAPSEDPWAAAQAAPAPSHEQGPASALLEQIAACQTTDELKKLWATNQQAFADQAVMDAWKARGRALKAGA
ncbi:hypothetical protein [Streptomyces sp. NPDC006134]|uniref:hypothetical protein n=1 Tax=Streptomyces sp. NPDC006134 TaxID=3154467 RepID=UPI0033F92872